MPIDRVEVRITDYNQRLQRTTMHGAYDTGPSGQLLGKPVLLRIFADGVIGYGHVRPTTPGHSMPDTSEARSPWRYAIRNASPSRFQCRFFLTARLSVAISSAVRKS